MRIWHRRAMAWIGSLSPAVMPIRAVNLGVAENCSAATSKTVNVRSLTPGRSCARHLAARFDPLEELVDVLTYFVATVEAAPQHSQVAYELVAGIDGHEIALGGGVEFGVIAIGHAYQHRLDIG